MSDLRDMAVANARAEFSTAPPTFAEPETCNGCGARVQLNLRDGLFYNAEPTPYPLAHTCKLPNGRYDSQARRRAKRSGRETGCWTYIPAEDLQAAGFEPGGELPYNLYNEQ